ncbi:MAG TPA: type II toxin-antitoxin system VapC family toxin [Thermoanaerobaculia bacterium]|nr:type II toxin-antitoxin system VapC family toxin [Thermoanaerobaculia bacterium]
MTGIDTNVLLRHILEDEPEQTSVVNALIEKAENDREGLYVNTIVLCELIWTLRSAYRARRSEIVSVLEDLLASQVFEIQDRDLVQCALQDYRHGKADFSDYLLGWQNREAGCRETVSFDGGLKKATGFLVLG